MTAFVVPGIPRPKGSTVSFVGKRGRVVTKTDSPGLAAWTRDVGWAALGAHVVKAIGDEPVCLDVLFQFQRPRGSARAYPTVRPDIDKVLRGLLDALSGVAYADDAQVVELRVRKAYADAPRTIVTVSAVTE